MKVIRSLALLLIALAIVGCKDSPTGTDQATVVLRNQGTLAIWNVYISPCTDETWGSDQLGATEIIAPGAERSWSVAPGCYDLLAIYSDDADVEEWDRQLTAGATFTWNVSN